MNTLKNYYELCKPNVVLMMLITALVGSLLASKTLPPLSLIAFAMLGIALCASSAAAINQIIDRKVDANMNRTENRPIHQGDVSPVNASIFAYGFIEIWRYDILEGQGNIEFLFIERDTFDDEFQLVHSNLNNEMYSREWAQILRDNNF